MGQVFLVLPRRMNEVIREVWRDHGTKAARKRASQNPSETAELVKNSPLFDTEIVKKRDMESIKIFLILICIPQLLLHDLAFAQVTEQEATDDIEAFRNSSTGLSWGGGGDELVAKMRSDPAPYTNVLTGRLTFPDDENLLSYQTDVNDYAQYATLLAAIGTENAKTSLKNIYFNVVDDLEQLWDMREDAIVNVSPISEIYYAIGHAEFLQNYTLHCLLSVYDDGVLSDVLARYPSADVGTRAGFREYISYFGGAPATFDASLTGTWQMVSLPLFLTDSNYNTVFNSPLLNQAPYWWGGEEYIEEEVMVWGHGYWIEADFAGTQEIAGTPINKTTLNLDLGWNLFGGPSCDVNISDIDDPGSIIESNNLIYTWSSQGGYENPTAIEQGRGYWISTIASGQITLDCNASAKTDIALAQYQPLDNGFHTLTIRDAQNRNQTLYFGNVLPETNRGLFKLPPVGPGDILDARFSGGTQLLEGMEGAIQITTNYYPVTLELGNYTSTTPLSIEEIVRGRVISTRPLTPGQLFEITNPDVSSIQISQP